MTNQFWNVELHRVDETHGCEYEELGGEKMRKKKAKYVFAVYYKEPQNCIYRIAEAKILNIPDEEQWFNVPITQVFR